MTVLRTRMLHMATNLVGNWVYRRGNQKPAASANKISRSITIRGHKIWYQDIGSGPPVVLLHGLGASALSWLLTLPALSTNHRVIALDQIGHGRSDKPLIEYRISEFVDYLEAFLSELGLTEIDIAGNSLGGWIAARLAVRRPDLVRRLALVCSAGLRPSQELRARLEQVKFAPRTIADTRSILSMCFHNKTRHANQVNVIISYLMRQLEANHTTVERVLSAVYDPDEWMDEQMDRVRARTLVLWGRQDELMPVEFAERYAAGIPNARLEIFEECGHVPQIERARDFNRVITEFFS